jgi:hypothetical protein
MLLLREKREIEKQFFFASTEKQAKPQMIDGK